MTKTTTLYAIRKEDVGFNGMFYRWLTEGSTSTNFDEAVKFDTHHEASTYLLAQQEKYKALMTYYVIKVQD